MLVPLRFAASSSVWMNSKETPSLSAMLPRFSTRSSKAESPRVTARAAAPNAATPPTASVNGLTRAATLDPIPEMPAESPPENTRDKPSPALASPENRPATFPSGPGRADRMPESSLNWSLPPLPAVSTAVPVLFASIVALANDAALRSTALLKSSCVIAPARRSVWYS